MSESNLPISERLTRVATAADQLTATVQGQLGKIDKQVEAKSKEVDTFLLNGQVRLDSMIESAKKGYPAFNLFNNSRLTRVVGETKTPAGFYLWNSRISVKMEVMDETPGDWWRTPGKFVRVTVSWEKVAGPKYGSIWTESTGVVASNASDFIKTTRGFDYRIVKNDGISYFGIGWETGRNNLDLTKTDWTKAKPLTLKNRQSNVICSYWVPEESEKGEFIFDLRNIFVNLGDAEHLTLGIDELTQLVHPTSA
ncbi:hypothetical protein [Pseudoalteromonas xiamenensis]|uniref:Uncharacterized protein n=1 Tax=Pseudoalteromonas xiamenensis TaxID=882626 RepID=A0A975DH09_9GAMM|nr:hypothetical protein [Pseudoalteromonas xiamenensis]QTH70957.1 hypothetical protein J5O05_13900 [Pseudoalteromonas xiamenensis]